MGNRRIPPGTREEARRLYRLGLDTRAVGALLNVHATTVGRWVRGEGPKRARRKLPVSDERIRWLREVEGLTFEAISQRVRMSKSGARRRYAAASGRPGPERAAS